LTGNAQRHHVHIFSSTVSLWPKVSGDGWASRRRPWSVFVCRRTSTSTFIYTYVI